MNYLGNLCLLQIRIQLESTKSTKGCSVVQLDDFLMVKKCKSSVPYCKFEARTNWEGLDIQLRTGFPLDLAKVTWDPKFEPNDSDPYPTRYLKYAHSKVDPKPEPNYIRLEIFYKVALFLHDKHIEPKISWPEIDQNRSSPDPNRTDPKYHLTQSMTPLKFNLMHTRIERPIYQV